MATFKCIYTFELRSARAEASSVQRQKLPLANFIPVSVSPISRRSLTANQPDRPSARPPVSPTVPLLASARLVVPHLYAGRPIARFHGTTKESYIWRNPRWLPVSVAVRLGKEIQCRPMKMILPFTNWLHGSRPFLTYGAYNDIYRSKQISEAGPALEVNIIAERSEERFVAVLSVIAGFCDATCQKNRKSGRGE